MRKTSSSVMDGLQKKKEKTIEKRRGVCAGASVAGVRWLFLQNVSDI